MRGTLLAVVISAALLTGCGERADENQDARSFLGEASGPFLIPERAPGRWVISGVKTGSNALGVRVEDDAVSVFAEDPSDEALAGAMFAGTTPYVDVDLRDPDVEVEGQPGVFDATPTTNDLYVAPSLTWRESSGLTAVVWGADADRDRLLSFATGVDVTDDGPVSRASDLQEVGSLERDWSFPDDAVRVFLAQPADETRVHAVTIRRAGPEEVLAFRALLKSDPGRAFQDIRELLDREGYEPPEEIEIDGHRSWVGMLSADTRALVVDGDPGAVLLSNTTEEQPRLLTHEELAQSLQPLDEAGLDDRAEEANRQAAENNRVRASTFFGQPAWERDDGETWRSLHQVEFNFRSQALGPGGGGVPAVCLLDQPQSYELGTTATRGNAFCAPFEGDDLTAASLLVPDTGDPEHEDVWGTASARVARVTVTLPDGTVLEAPLQPTDERRCRRTSSSACRRS